jgi:transposase
MFRVQLPPVEVERLEEAFRSTEDRKLRDRLQIVLLAARGRKHRDIAADLCVNRRTVQRWLNAYLERGLDGLRPRKDQGASGKIPVGLADEIKRWVIDGPTGQGLDRTNWTHAELADHQFKTHGVAPSRSAMHRFCSRVAIRPPLPADLSLPAGRPGQAGTGQGGHGGPEKGAAAGELVLLSQDEARFQMAPTLRATLGVKGHRPVVGTRDCKDVLYLPVQIWASAQVGPRSEGHSFRPNVWCRRGGACEGPPPGGPRAATGL